MCPDTRKKYKGRANQKRVKDELLFPEVTVDSDHLETFLCCVGESYQNRGCLVLRAWQVLSVGNEGFCAALAAWS